MYKLTYYTVNELYETQEKHEALFTSVDKALDALRNSVDNPEKIKLSDYSTEDKKEFRWLHVKQKYSDEDNYYYKLDSLVYVDVDPISLSASERNEV